MEIKNININSTIRLTFKDKREVEFYKVDDKKVHLAVYINRETILNKPISNKEFAVILGVIAEFHEDRVAMEIDKLKNGNLTYEKRTKEKM